MRLPNKLPTGNKVDSKILKKAINDLIDVVKSQQLSSDGRTTRIKKTPSGTTVEAMIKSTVTSPTGSSASSAYNGGFTIKNISTYNEATGAFAGKVIITLGSSYVAADSEASPPVSESYAEFAGSIYINALYTQIESEKFDITESKSVVVYSEITNATPFIGATTIKFIDDVETDLPDKFVYIWLGDIKFTAQKNSFGDEDFVQASITINQVWEDGSSAYLPAFRDGNLTS